MRVHQAFTAASYRVTHQGWVKRAADLNEMFQIMLVTKNGWCSDRVETKMELYNAISCKINGDIKAVDEQDKLAHTVLELN